MTRAIDAARKQGRLEGLQEAEKMAQGYINGCEQPPQGSESRKEYIRGQFDVANKILAEIRDAMNGEQG